MLIAINRADKLLQLEKGGHSNSQDGDSILDSEDGNFTEILSLITVSMHPAAILSAIL